MSRRINGDLSFIFFPHSYKARERSSGMDGMNYQKDFDNNFERKVKQVMFDGIDDIHGECTDEDYINFINEQKAKKSETFKNKESNDIPKKTVKSKDDFFKTHPSITFGIFVGVVSIVYGMWKANVIATGIHMGNLRTLETLARLTK